jgi:hypothetical protein
MRKTRNGEHRRRIAFTTFNRILHDAWLERKHRESFLPAQTSVEQPFRGFDRVQDERFFRRGHGEDNGRYDPLGMTGSTMDECPERFRREPREPLYLHTTFWARPSVQDWLLVATITNSRRCTHCNHDCKISILRRGLQE